jgi:glycosyltransferase involved in cell wall biosynthesis
MGGHTDISVITMSLEQGRFIREALESVMSQNHMSSVSVEHIVVDGDSRDGTVDVLRVYDQHVQWISERDDGQAAAFNKGLGMASGEWIAWLNADEFYLPFALSSLLHATRSNADVVFGDAILVDEDGCFIRLLPQHAAHLTLLRRYGPVAQTVTALFRRSALDAIGGLHPRSRATTDWHVYISLAKMGAKFAHIRVPIGAFRVHAGSFTSSTPLTAMEPEFRWFRALHGVHPRAPYREPLGRWWHRSLKLLDRAYLRQIKASLLLRGADMRWFRSPEALRACETLSRRVYRLPNSKTIE